METKRILTGDRPTGAMHIGHYVGSLQKRVELQHSYDTFIIVADLHTLTTKPNKEDLKDLQKRIKEQVLTYLAVGLDPKKVKIYRQSAIPEVTELATIFGMLVTVPRLERVPTLKEQLDNLHIAAPSFGLLGYPVLQAADILMVRADCVPVGVDQASHLEVTREIARSFNAGFGPVFPEPSALLSAETTLVGTDGKAKMSKSLGNAIGLFDDEREVEQKVMRMYTDPNRVRPTDKGEVVGNPVFTYHDLFNTKKDEVSDLKERYRNGAVGDVEVKKKLAKAIIQFLAPIQDRAKIYRKDSLLEGILEDGTKQTRTEAIKTLDLVKHAMGL